MREIDYSNLQSRDCMYFSLGKCLAKKCNYGRKIDGKCKARGSLNKLAKGGIHEE